MIDQLWAARPFFALAVLVGAAGAVLIRQYVREELK